MQKPTVQAAHVDPSLAILMRLEASMGELKLNSATKEDLTTLRTQMQSDTKVLVAQAVDPVKDEVSDLKTRLTTLEHQVNTGASSNSEVSSLQKMVGRLERELNSKKVTFIGWPATLDETSRSAAVLKFVQDKVPTLASSITSQCSYEKFQKESGPRTLSGVHSVEFSTPGQARKFLSKAKDLVIQHAGSTIDIKPPRNQQQTDRNNSLRDLLKKVQDSGRPNAKSAEIEWLATPRKIKIGQEVIYEQNLRGVGGKLPGSFSDWTP